MRRGDGFWFPWLAVALCILLVPASAFAQVQVPPGFIWQLFAQGFNGVKHSVIDPPGGAYGGQMYVTEIGGGVADRVTPNGAWGLFSPPGPPLFAGPVGIAIDPGNLYQGQMYVAESGGPNLWQVAPNGAAAVFCNALAASGGIAFDPGLGYGGLLYCAEWMGAGGPGANTVMTVSPAGLPAFFAALPGADPRYLAFDTTVPPQYGGTLWVSEFATGNVVSVTPGGVVNPPLANVGAGVEGIAFGLGDVWFGLLMYAANLNNGAILTVSPAGAVANFATIVPSAAYIQFVPAGSPYAWNNLPTMYVDDGGGNIYRIGPNPAVAAERATWGRIKTLYR